MIRSVYNQSETVTSAFAGRRAIVEVTSRPRIVTMFKDDDGTTKCFVGNRKVRPDEADTFVGSFAPQPNRSRASEAYVDVETIRKETSDDDKCVEYRLTLDSYDLLAEEEESERLHNQRSRIFTLCWARLNRIAKRDERRRCRRMRPVLYDAQTRFAGYGPRKPSPKTGHPTGHKPRYKDIARDSGRMAQLVDDPRISEILDQIENDRRLAKARRRLAYLIGDMEVSVISKRLAEVVAPLRQFLDVSERKAA